MALQLSSADAAFQDEVRAFLDAELTEDLREAGRLCSGIYCDRPVAQKWLSILNTRGWATPSWPLAYGGADWSPVQAYIFASELAKAEAPPVTPNATRMLGPVLIAFGTPEQKARYLPRIPTGEDWWAQGYSEPQAGSDLAALQCRAERDADAYVLNGQKIWTSHAQWSNRIFCLVRTRFDGKPQAGISFLVFDMDLPGITVRPIITLAGDHEVNEVFFENVRVPLDALVGEENGGWGVAKYLLAHERGGQSAPQLGVRLRRLRNILDRLTAGTAGAEAAALRRRISEASIRLEALDHIEQQAVSRQSLGQEPGNESSMLKILATELKQEMDVIGMDLAGVYARPNQASALHALRRDQAVGPPELVTMTAAYLNNRAASIYAGSNEIQRNIISAQILKL